MTTALETDVLNPQFQAILDAELPTVLRTDLRPEGPKVWAKEIRSLFKAMGLAGIKVTTPYYSLTWSIDIALPKSDHEPIILGEDGYPTQYPSHLTVQHAASDKVRAIVLAAFPDLDDHADSRYDASNFRLSIH